MHQSKKCLKAISNKMSPSISILNVAPFKMIPYNDQICDPKVRVRSILPGKNAFQRERIILCSFLEGCRERSDMDKADNDHSSVSLYWFQLSTWYLEDRELTIANTRNTCGTCALETLSCSAIEFSKHSEHKQLQFQKVLCCSNSSIWALDNLLE